MKKILFLGNDLGYFLSHRLPMAKAAHMAGYEVHVATPPASGTELVLQEKLLYHPYSLSRWGGKLSAELMSLWEIFCLFRSIRPDLVHQVTIKPVIYGGLMARLARVPALVSAVSGLGSIFLRQDLKGRIVCSGARLAYRLALSHPRSKVIFQNPDDLTEFIGRRLVAEEKTVLIRGSGVDVEQFSVKPEQSELVTVVFPSRMLWDKGIREFVEAAGAIKAEGRGIRFALVGTDEPGNPASVPLQILKEWHDSGVVEWWGFREDMPTVFSLAHVVCLPSYREGVPKALIEAAAAGRPIVTTDVPGCREIVRNEWNGLLVPARDSRLLADALRRLAADPSLRAAMGANGRQLAVQEFSVARVINQTLAVYDGLLS